MSNSDFSWAKPIMQAGYAGRGLTYVAVAGLSLWSIWRGGSAQGTSSTLEALQGTIGGLVLVSLIAAGLIGYMIWRLIDAAWDLEDYGTDAKGIIARLGMVVTGLVHGALGYVAVRVLTGGGSGGGGGVAGVTAQVMQMQGGRWIIGIAALCTLGAGIYYVHKAWSQSYLEDLEANHFTTNWNTALRAGVLAQGIIVFVAGLLLGFAALYGDPNQAGGLKGIFDYLQSQPFGNIIVVAICIGLLGFALFCFVNAAYRIIPKIAGGDVETLAQRLKAKAA